MAQLLRYTANDPTGLAKTLAENSKHRKEFWTTVVSVLRFYLTD
jgi:hypothetical protein